MTGDRFGMVPVSVVADWKLGHVGLRVYVALACFADRRRFARPSVAQLAEASGLSRRSVQRGLAELVDLGHVERITTGSSHLASVYRLPMVIHRGDTTGTPGVSELTPGVSGSARLGDTTGTPTYRTELEQRRKRRAAQKGDASAYPDDHGKSHPNEPFTDSRGTFLPGTGWVP